MIDRTLIGLIVFLKTDSECLPRIIIGYKVSKASVIYELAQSTMASWHYDYEFVFSKDYLKNKIGF